MCDKDCSTTTCPFAFTEESEQLQSYECLPDPHAIRYMRIHHGKTWACHSDPTKPCAGAIKDLKEDGLDYKVIDPDLVTLDDNWEALTPWNAATVEYID